MAAALIQEISQDEKERAVLRSHRLDTEPVEVSRPAISCLNKKYQQIIIFCLTV